MNLKVILFIFMGALMVVGVIVAMNVYSGGGGSFEGGMSTSALPRDIPQGRANPFDVVPADEADNRATANTLLAEEAIAGSETKAYTAAPVIQIEGNSGDAKDPMADQLVPQDVEEAPPAQSKIVNIPIEPIETDLEVATPPEVDYQIQQTDEAAEPAAPNPSTMGIMMGLTRGTAGPRVVIDTFDQNRDRGASPFQAQEFK